LFTATSVRLRIVGDVVGFETCLERVERAGPIALQPCPQLSSAARAVTPENRHCVRLVQCRALSLEQRVLRGRRLIGERTIEIRPRLVEIA